jgi:hypothetical protein
VGAEHEYFIARLKAAHGLNGPTSPTTPVRIKSYIEEREGVETKISQLADNTGISPDLLRTVILVNGRISESKVAAVCRSLRNMKDRYGEGIIAELDESSFKEDGNIFKRRTKERLNGNGIRTP